jgi:hypothetical protein
MKATNPNSTWWLNSLQRNDSTALKILFLMCFVALQVMTKGAW